MVQPERTDRLRRRPDRVRYFYLGISDNMLHTGLSYGGLQYANSKHTIKEVFLADLVTEKVIHVNEPIEDFMDRWRLNYNRPEWDYADDIAKGVPKPIF